MAEKLLKKLHFIILAYTGLMLFTMYEEHMTKLEEVENRKPTLRKEINSLKEKLELARTFQDDLEQSKQRLVEVANDIEEIQRQLPATIEDSEVLDLFGKEADLIKIKDLTLKPGSEKKKDFYFVKDYNFTAVGTFLQFLIYFERIANSSRLINVTKLKMEIPTDDTLSRGRFQLVKLSSVMEVFRYDADHKETVETQEKEEEKKQ